MLKVSITMLGQIKIVTESYQDLQKKNHDENEKNQTESTPDTLTSQNQQNLRTKLKLTHFVWFCLV